MGISRYFIVSTKRCKAFALVRVMNYVYYSLLNVEKDWYGTNELWLKRRQREISQNLNHLMRTGYKLNSVLLSSFHHRPAIPFTAQIFCSMKREYHLAKSINIFIIQQRPLHSLPIALLFSANQTFSNNLWMRFIRSCWNPTIEAGASLCHTLLIGLNHV